MYILFFAPVAQLDRASDYESEGQEFESSRVHHYKTQPLIGVVFLYVLREDENEGIRIERSIYAEATRSRITT